MSTPELSGAHKSFGQTNRAMTQQINFVDNEKRADSTSSVCLVPMLFSGRITRKQDVSKADCGEKANSRVRGEQKQKISKS